MNYYDAIQIRSRHARGQPVGHGEVAAADEYIRRVRHPGIDTAPTPPARFIQAQPNFDTPCECSLRYGMHRVADFACPNPNWRPGNGQLQWLERKWKRA